MNRVKVYVPVDKCRKCIAASRRKDSGGNIKLWCGKYKEYCVAVTRKCAGLEP